MSSSSGFLDALLKTDILPVAERGQVKTLQRQFPQPRALLDELIRRRWLTVFQATQLLKGKGEELVLGPYVIMARIGKGGFGQVFKARHQRMNRMVALKALRADAIKDRESVQRFYREIEVASRLSHPNIVHAYEAGPINSILVLVLEYVEGQNLEQKVEQSGPLALAQACDYVRQAAIGLQYAHEQGLIHRDIKPSNLLVSEPGNPADTSLSGFSGPWGTVKILDLGLARLQEPPEGSQTTNLTITSGESVMLGSADYMSPEQAVDFHSADVRSDIYSLGCTFFYLLAGKPPFPGKTLAEKLMKHQQAAAPLKELPSMPGDLKRVITRMLAKRPQDRFATPGEVADAIAPHCAIESTMAITRTAAGVIGPLATIKAKAAKSLLHSSGMLRQSWSRQPTRRRKIILLVTGTLVAMGLVVLFMRPVLYRSPAPSVHHVSTTRPARPPVIDMSVTMNSKELKTNGNAHCFVKRLRLTEAKTKMKGSAYFSNKVGISAFTTEFRFRIISAKADGFTFTIQNQGLAALGAAGGGLGYLGIGKSVAVKFDTYGGGGEDNSIGLFTNGAIPTKPFHILKGVSLKSEHIMEANLTYRDKLLKVVVKDTETNLEDSRTYPVDIPALVGGPEAYVGFTAATGGETGRHIIENWTFHSQN